MGLFFLSIIVEIIIQITLIVKLKKRSNKEYWTDIKINAIVMLITSIIAISYYTNNGHGLSDAIGILFIAATSLLTNLITFIIALLIKKRLKKIITNEDQIHIPTTGILIFITNIFIILILPIITNTINTSTGKEVIYSYLKDKYGDHNYEVINIYDQYNYSGMWDKYHSGYYYEIKCDTMNDTFFIALDDSLEYIESDFFIPIYYSMELDLEYSIEYNDFSEDLDWDFDEFNTYIATLINNEYQTDLDEYDINEMYISFADSWNSRNGVTYGDNYYIIQPNKQKIPTIEEIASNLYTYHNK